MGILERTGQVPMADGRVSDSVHDYMYGFDVEDNDERQYLANVAIHRIGHQDDIEDFVRLSLLRGVEEWEQAICCASAMKGQASFDDPLDGQDILTFLYQIYHLDEQSQPACQKPSALRLKRPSSKRKRKKAHECLDTHISVDIPTKKQGKERKGSRTSRYWLQTTLAGDNQSSNSPEATYSASKARKQPDESLRPVACPLSIILPGSPINRPIIDEYYEPGRTSVCLDGYDESLTRVPLTDAQWSVRRQDNGNMSETLGRLGSSVSESALSTPARDAEAELLSPRKQSPKRKAKSPYFEITPTPSPQRLKSLKPPRGTISSIPFPRLNAPKFGLIQEELAEDPFRLLVAVTFLIRTPGKSAIPVFRALMAKYPTPRDLVEANTDDIVAMIKHLGLGVVRAATIQRYARIWLDHPPRKGMRYGVKNYPRPGDGADVRAGEILDDEDQRTSAWEIGHMTQGPYALDSWRIFCRDRLRGVAEDWKGKGREGEFQPEWMRVLPQDKELRAYLRWMWFQEGWNWDPNTGEKEILPKELMRAVQDARIGYDDTGNVRILDKEPLDPAV
ncbi:DNA glycosylase [Xylariaceae sp. FL1651]|nr:DNA glycosylase [Xylariaceae sp. FL1651]